MEENRSLTARTLNALRWRFGFIGAKLVLQLAVVVVLSRILPVEAFGLVAQAMIVVGLLQVISESGMAPALIHCRDLTPLHQRVAMTLAVALGLLLMLIVWGVAPAIAWAMRCPELAPVLRGLACSFLFASPSSAAGALLQRQLNFRMLFWVELSASLIGDGCVGISLALMGCEVWALVFGTLTTAALTLALMVMAAQTKLRPAFHWAEARTLLSFGAGMSAARLALYLARNADYLVVARAMGADALGLYTRAYQLMTLPIGRFSGVINTVMFPAYAEIQDDNPRLRRIYYENIGVVSIVVFPVLAGMAVASREIVYVLLSAKWLASAAPFRVLCFAGMFLCVHNIGEALCRAKGDVAGRLWRHVVYVGAIVACVSFGLQWGITGAAYGVTAALCLQYLLMGQLTIHLVEGSWRAFFGAHLAGLALAGVAAAAAGAAAVGLRPLAPPWCVLLISTLASAGLVGASLLMLPRRVLPQLLARHVERAAGALRRVARPIRQDRRATREPSPVKSAAQTPTSKAA